MEPTSNTPAEEREPIEDWTPAAPVSEPAEEVGVPAEETPEPVAPVTETAEPAAEMPAPDTAPWYVPEVEPAPARLEIEDAEPVIPAEPDLAAVEAPAPQPDAATNMDLPSLDLPFPAAPVPPAAPYAESPYPSAPVPPVAAGYGQPTYPQAPPAQAAYAQPSYGQPSYGQPAPDQPAYGHPGAYGQPSGYGQMVPASGLSQTEETTWAAAAHWSAIVASFVGLGFLGPLLVMLIQGPKSARVRANAVESLNFEITFVLSMIASVLLMLVVVGFFTIFLLPLAWLVLRIIASVQTSSGQDYRYPVNLRLVK